MGISRALFGGLPVLKPVVQTEARSKKYRRHRSVVETGKIPGCLEVKMERRGRTSRSFWTTLRNLDQCGLGRRFRTRTRN